MDMIGRDRIELFRFLIPRLDFGDIFDSRTARLMTSFLREAFTQKEFGDVLLNHDFTLSTDIFRP